jgi:hypothetical protein
MNSFFFFSTDRTSAVCDDVALPTVCFCVAQAANSAQQNMMVTTLTIFIL